MAVRKTSPPDSLEGLRALVDQRYEELPARLQDAVRFLMDSPSQGGVETVKTLAESAGVQPSVLVRLAKALGYSGFSQMQAVFRDALLAQTQSYGERMRVQRRGRRDALPQSPDDMLRMICEASIGSLQGLGESVDAAALGEAIALLDGAR